MEYIVLSDNILTPGLEDQNFRAVSGVLSRTSKSMKTHVKVAFGSIVNHRSFHSLFGIMASFDRLQPPFFDCDMLSGVTLEFGDVTLDNVEFDVLFSWYVHVSTYCIWLIGNDIRKYPDNINLVFNGNTGSQTWFMIMAFKRLFEYNSFPGKRIVLDIYKDGVDFSEQDASALSQMNNSCIQNGIDLHLSLGGHMQYRALHLLYLDCSEYNAPISCLQLYDVIMDQLDLVIYSNAGHAINELVVNNVGNNSIEARNILNGLLQATHKPLWKIRAIKIHSFGEFMTTVRNLLHSEIGVHTAMLKLAWRLSKLTDLEITDMSMGGFQDVQDDYLLLHYLVDCIVLYHDDCNICRLCLASNNLWNAHLDNGAVETSLGIQAIARLIREGPPLVQLDLSGNKFHLNPKTKSNK